MNCFFGKSELCFALFVRKHTADIKWISSQGKFVDGHAGLVPGGNQ